VNTRRLLLGAALALPTAACENVGNILKPRQSASSLPRPERMVRWLVNTGRDNMMSPEALTIMGLRRPNNMDIPVKQTAETGPDGRYTVSLTGFRQIWEFIFHHRSNDEVLLFHHADKNFTRLSTVRFPRNGRPLIVTDAALADADFQKQTAFWFNIMPAR
jgi:hypothetical protein